MLPLMDWSTSSSPSDWPKWIHQRYAPQDTIFEALLENMYSLWRELNNFVPKSVLIILWAAINGWLEQIFPWIKLSWFNNWLAPKQLNVRFGSCVKKAPSDYFPHPPKPVCSMMSYFSSSFSSQPTKVGWEQLNQENFHTNLQEHV